MGGYNPFSLEGKTILITGASSGIGKTTAIECAKLGAHVILSARNEERLTKVLNSLEGDGHRIVISDLTNSEDCDKLVNKTGKIDGILLCVGKAKTMPVQFTKRELFDDIFEINFFAIAETLRLLYKKKNIGKGASVVLVSSIGGLYAFGGCNCAYGASKAALNSFMKFAASEFSPRKVRVNSVCPGMIETPFIHRGTISEEQLQADREKYPLKRYGRPEDVAYGIIYLLSDASAWVTGTSLVIDGGRTI